jgi:hypothetical protein
MYRKISGLAKEEHRADAGDPCVHIHRRASVDTVFGVSGRAPRFGLRFRCPRNAGTVVEHRFRGDGLTPELFHNLSFRHGNQGKHRKKTVPWRLLFLLVVFFLMLQRQH